MFCNVGMNLSDSLEIKKTATTMSLWLWHIPSVSNLGFWHFRCGKDLLKKIRKYLTKVRALEQGKKTVLNHAGRVCGSQHLELLSRNSIIPLQFGFVAHHFECCSSNYQGRSRKYRQYFTLQVYHMTVLTICKHLPSCWKAFSSFSEQDPKQAQPFR